MLYPFTWPRITDAARSGKSADIAKRRLHDTLSIDRTRATRHDDSEILLRHLLQEDLWPKERRPA
jgi:hypothetical protein